MEKKEKEAKKLQLKISQEFGLLSLCSNIKTRMVLSQNQIKIMKVTCKITGEDKTSWLLNKKL